MKAHIFGKSDHHIMYVFGLPSRLGRSFLHTNLKTTLLIRTCSLRLIQNQCKCLRFGDVNMLLGYQKMIYLVQCVYKMVAEKNNIKTVVILLSFSNLSRNIFIFYNYNAMHFCSFNLMLTHNHTREFSLEMEQES